VTTPDEPCAAAPLLDGQEVADVVVRLPKTLGPRATLAEARAAFEDDHVHMLLLTEGGRLLGTLLRTDLPAPGSDGGRALAVATLEGRIVSPRLPAEEARELLLTTGQRRLAVVDDSGRLLGLLCLKRRLTDFCSDADVAARAADPSTPRAPRGAPDTSYNARRSG
jgi:CBS domain-containing protein